MTGWEDIAMGDLGRVVTGRTPPARFPEAFGDDYPFITPTDMDGRRYIDRTERCVSESGAAGMSRQRIPAGAVIVSCIGWQLGKVAIAARESFTNQQLNTIVPDEALVDSVFLYYHLRTRRDEIKQLASGGTRTPILNKSRFEALPIRLPPRGIQARIGAVLSCIDDLIENNRRRVEVLAEMARLIYREWFVHFRYPGHESATFIESALGPMPDGWAIRSFAEVASFVNGFAFKPEHWGNEGRPIIKIKQLKQGVTADTPRCRESSIVSRYWVEPGALLFSWSADLGVYRWAGEPGLLNQHLFRVESSGDLSRSYLFHALDDAMPQFWSRAQGTTMRHIKRSALSEVLVAVPASAVVGQFTSMVEPMSTEILMCQRTLRNLESMRDLLLPKLVTGEIDVSSLDLDALVADRCRR